MKKGKTGKQKYRDLLPECSIPSCSKKALMESIFCGEHERIKIPK